MKRTAAKEKAFFSKLKYIREWLIDYYKTKARTLTFSTFYNVRLLTEKIPFFIKLCHFRVVC